MKIKLTAKESDFRQQQVNKSQSKNKVSMKQSPQKRYMKRVLNKDIDNTRIYKQQSKSPQNQQSKKLFRSPHHNSNKKMPFHQQNIMQQPCEQSVNNFSLGLFTKLHVADSSFLRETHVSDKKSKERKLDFNKIFIVSQQNSPFKQVIQLSIRQLENKQMLEKAIQQLERKKLHKKYKILKKQMKLNLSSGRTQDPSIQQLRSHRIGYKTFYQKEIMTERLHHQDQKKEDKSYMIKTPKRSRSLVSQQQDLKTNLNQKEARQQKQKEYHTKNKYNHQLQQNVFVQDQQALANKKRNYTGVQFTRKNKTVHTENSIDNNDRFTLMCKNREKNKKVSFKLSANDNIENRNQGRNNFSKFYQKESISKDKKRSQSERLQSQSQPTLYKPLQSIRLFPSLIKSSQNLKPIQLSTSSKFIKPSIKISRKLTEPQLKSQLQEDLQSKLKLANEEFPLLMTKQDLEGTLNKSRYQVKKLLCMHIQQRKKEWRKMKRKSLYEEEINKIGLSKSQGHIKTKINENNELATIEQAQNEIQTGEFLGQIRSSSSFVPPPTHMLKIHTRQLKTSIRSFVKRMKTSRPQVIKQGKVFY